MSILDIFEREEKPKPLVGAISPYVLLILDGWGLAPPTDGNAIYHAKTPNMDSYYQLYPHGELIASGESVGLPANEVGNTEVGHLTLGAGRVVLQDLKRISQTIVDGRFFDNKAFNHALNHAIDNRSNVHVMGLVGQGRVHSSMEHLENLMQFFRKYDFNRVYLHLFTDGRDSPPKSAIQTIRKIETLIEELKIARIATVCGRYYAMDRDRRWERTQAAYELLTSGKGQAANSAEEAINAAYLKGQTDEFVEPTYIVDSSAKGKAPGGPVATVNNNDAVIFTNFRIDRPRQLTMAFTLRDFEALKDYDFGKEPGRSRKQGKSQFSSTFQRTKKLSNMYFVTMTEYQKGLPVSEVAFPPEIVKNTIAQILSEAKFAQMHMTESEKERFVTYYFDGLSETPFPNSFVDIVKSPDVSTYDKKPEMAVHKIVNKFIKHLNQSKYNFFVLNFANPDMVAHSGDFDATLTAIEHVDKAIGKLVTATLAFQGTVLITADHGNAEDLLAYPETSFFYTSAKGDINTDHSNHPVPFIAINQKWMGANTTLRQGSLSDVAPTLLSLMGIRPPKEMTGKSLL